MQAASFKVFMLIATNLAVNSNIILVTVVNIGLRCNESLNDII